MDLNKVCYFLITGASRGIGRTMAIECSKKFQPGSVIVLLARSQDGLECTKNDIIEFKPDVIVKTYSIDLKEPTNDILDDIIMDSLKNIDPLIFELAFIINNHGTTGPIDNKAKDLIDLATWEDHFKLNVFSVKTLNSIFIERFKSTPKLIVNITSLCAIVPFKGLNFYCASKAAREMYFKVLAEEEPDIIVLNYSPGSVETAMFDCIRTNCVDDEIRKLFNDLTSQKKVLTTLETTKKFLSVLEAKQFKSGDHVDYYD